MTKYPPWQFLLFVALACAMYAADRMWLSGLFLGLSPVMVWGWAATKWPRFIRRPGTT